jgi:hypothetical protein
MVYEIPFDVSQAESWLGPQHAYHDVPLASIVNDYRVCRIFCQRVIMACVNWLGLGKISEHHREEDVGGGGDQAAAGEEKYERAVTVVQQMVDEISACVPFHMSYDMQPVAQELGQERNGEY